MLMVKTMVKRKVMVYVLTVLAIFNLLVVVSGIAIPWLISTNSLPVAAIFILVSALLGALATAVIFLIDKFLR